MEIVYILLSVIAVIAFVKDNFLTFLLCYFGLMTKLFMLDVSGNNPDFSGPFVQGSDLCILINFLLLPLVYKRQPELFSWKSDIIAMWLYIYMLFYVVELLVTTALGNETFFNGLKVIRVSFFMWSYFVFRSIPLEVYEKFIKVALYITLFQSVLYFLQFAGIYLLEGNTIGGENSQELGLDFAWNIPTLTLFFLYYTLKAEFNRHIKIILIVVFFSMIFLTFIRGLILSVIIGLAYYIYKQGSRGMQVPIIAGFMLVAFVASKFMNVKSENSMGDSPTDQLEEILSNADDMEFDYKGSGTMTFRMAMLAERIFYLIDNPQFLLTGVGTLHEDSPETVTRFDFKIGTLNDEKPNGICVIESGDITWVPIVLRYGLIGVIIHVMLFILMIRKTGERSDLLFILAPLYVGGIIRSFDGSFFEDPLTLYLIALFFAIVSRAEFENKQFGPIENEEEVDVKNQMISL